MPASLRLNFNPSRQWALCQGVLCCCALLAIVNLPLVLWQTITVVISLVVYGYCQFMAWHASAITVELQQHHSLLNDRRVLIRTAIVWPWLVVLAFRDAETQTLSRYLIWPDCCTADEHRQLRAYLRFYN